MLHELFCAVCCVVFVGVGLVCLCHVFVVYFVLLHCLFVCVFVCVCLFYVRLCVLCAKISVILYGVFRVLSCVCGLF